MPAPPNNPKANNTPNRIKNIPIIKSRTTVSLGRLLSSLLVPSLFGLFLLFEVFACSFLSAIILYLYYRKKSIKNKGETSPHPPPPPPQKSEGESYAAKKP